MARPNDKVTFKAVPFSFAPDLDDIVGLDLPNVVNYRKMIRIISDDVGVRLADRRGDNRSA